MSRRRSDLASGQALAEFALLAPMLIAILFGATNVGIMTTDMVRVDFAVREAGRLASATGASAVPSGSSSSTVYSMTASDDLVVVKDVLATAGAAHMPFAQPLEVDIYLPETNANGSYASGSDPVDAWDVSTGTPAQISDNFPLTSRSQTFPNETPIGVNITWSFSIRGAFGIPPISLHKTNYAVFRALAVQS